MFLKLGPKKWDILQKSLHIFFKKDSKEEVTKLIIKTEDKYSSSKICATHTHDKPQISPNRVFSYILMAFHVSGSFQLAIKK